jgi:hypothetical protein
VCTDLLTIGDGLYGFRYEIQRTIARMTKIRFFGKLFGDGFYIVQYLRCRYVLSQVLQTGSNFGVKVRHDTPKVMVPIDGKVRVADGLPWRRGGGAPLLSVVYSALVKRAVAALPAFRPQYCSIDELYFRWREVYRKLLPRAAPVRMNPSALLQIALSCK